MTNLQQIKQLAQQGQPEAIAALLNQSLTKEGLQADVRRSGELLYVTLTGQTAPERSWMQRLEVGFKRLDIDNVQQVQIQVFTTESQQVVWQHDIILRSTTGSIRTTTSQSSTPLTTQTTQSTKAVNQPIVASLERLAD
ncbi:MAG: hypothetical protein AAFQ57_08210, partial [Cyanobacteria bacterium J06626_14]